MFFLSSVSFTTNSEIADSLALLYWQTGYNSFVSFCSTANMLGFIQSAFKPKSSTLSKLKTDISPLTKPKKSGTAQGAETPTTIVDNDAVIMMALNTCRASLLPDRHSECVVAVARTPEISDATEAMKTCISAEDFPRQLYSDN